MTGEEVVVGFKHETGKDPYGSPIYETDEETVGDVLVIPGDREDLSYDRPEGVRVLYQLHFPKTFNKNLENQQVKVRGEWLDVIGSPDHFILANTPTRWWMEVEVGTTHG